MAVGVREVRLEAAPFPTPVPFQTEVTIVTPPLQDPGGLILNSSPAKALAVRVSADRSFQ